jgi:uncharacterized membrane protein YphA (DoxX/SURF4 family)
MSTRRWSFTAVTAAAVVGTIPSTAAAHVDYVTDPVGHSRDAIAFVAEVLGDPLNAALVGGGALFGVVALATYLRYRPTVPDVEILRETLATYYDLVPWMLRLSLGLPLVGAGFQGYLFAPTVAFDASANSLLRLLLIGVGFFILFGLATRIVTAVGLALYLWALAANPDVILAIEYLPGFVAVFVLGGGRPSADDMLQEVAQSDATFYGRVDPVHHLKAWLDDVTTPYRRFVPTLLRVGMGVAFVYLGLVEKLGSPDRALQVVEKYDLTAVIPVDPGMWVLGAGLMEIAVGLALVVGLLTRASAATAFVLFTLTLFGLPDDPVLAHVSLFGIASAIFTLGAGPFSLDERLARAPASEATKAPGDD